MSVPRCCAQCGATYEVADMTCSDRFAELLALDHSRTEPWGSRHGLAFSAYVLQHTREYAVDVSAGAWRMLYRVVVHGADRSHVAAEMRALRGGSPAYAHVPPFPGGRPAPAAFAMTIADLGTFDAAAYPALLDGWCRATLAAHGAFGA